MIDSFEIMGASILIVDDQEANIALLQQVLGEAGYTNVTATSNPVGVAAQHRGCDYDLILLDLQMPGMDGFQVIDAIKAENSDGYLPVIVLTAQPALKLRALQAGAKDFIAKPFDLVEVKTRIYNMLEVRLLYRKLEDYSRLLEQKVEQRTAELRDSEARYRSLTELASDWYWEQDEAGNFTQVSGPVLEMLGVDGIGEVDAADLEPNGWNPAERQYLRETIAARQPFLDFVFSRKSSDGSQRSFRVSGEPIFNQRSRFKGYRGIGIEFVAKTGVPAGMI